MIIFSDLLPLKDRPKFFGFIGATFGIASIGGPLLGGVFTSKLTWRWCFWINVPIGVVAIAVLLFILPAKPPPRNHTGDTFLQRVKQFDPLGTALLLPGLVLLLLALQWGGIGYAWGSARVAVCLALGLALLVAFAISQVWTGENGTVPPRILLQRTIAAGTVVSLGFGAALIIVTFYLPIWFQAVQSKTAFEAGIRLLPYFLGTVFFVITSGFVVSKTGYYTPPLILGTALVIIGCGLLTTFGLKTSNGEWIGYEVSIPCILMKSEMRETDADPAHRQCRSRNELGPNQQRMQHCPLTRRHPRRRNSHNVCATNRRHDLRQRFSSHPIQ